PDARALVAYATVAGIDEGSTTRCVAPRTAARSRSSFSAEACRTSSEMTRSVDVRTAIGPRRPQASPGASRTTEAAIGEVAPAVTQPDRNNRMRVAAERVIAEEETSKRTEDATEPGNGPVPTASQRLEVTLGDSGTSLAGAIYPFLERRL